ncbi:transglycosylase domain-containing protein [Altererythrobacter sp. TH136]|uniref:penicillin-binding protein 1A n=1 Tax=Altererythrobacter sp. TH136 TaxID=2067415 RepID=UPI0011621698|nr:transglycosylase domain-containing protein [Altererythrobacter sp. TH136]QDM40002.1 penicillin-binding protein [Altererythrobacter sp. TH136]
MADSTTLEHIRYRIRRDTHGAIQWFRDNWRERRWFRWLASLIAGGLLLLVIGWIILARDLPSADTLVDYEPPLPTIVRGIDGQIVHSYARERRVQLQYADFPQELIESFLAAEDKTFFSHGGVDITGTIGAAFDYATKFSSGERAVGGSTITQQVAKNILLGDEYSVTRKLKEMILARRIEGVLTKPQILELYLNEIPLGRRSYGVQAASRAYFDKDVGELNLHEMAFLAILPKAPERYGRARYEDLAITRRNFVLDQMVANDFVTAQEGAAAKAQPLGLKPSRSAVPSVDAGYFLEEVRRLLMAKFGETAEDGKNSVYAGGLWVRTSLDPELQLAARDALRGGILRYSAGKGWSGPIAQINVDDDTWQSQLAASPLGISYKDWRVGVVVERSGGSGRIGFSDGDTAPLTGMPDALKAGDVIAAAPVGDSYAVRSVPEVSGGMVAEEPATGRVLALQGGFDHRLTDFNRATQALRQPGSTIKPFVYATGLDQGMTPATEVPDQSYCFYQGAALGEKCFRNFGGGGGGVHTMRWGLEQSRNLMTVHIAMDAGMPNVVRTFERLGIGSYKPYPAFALGAGDTTVLKMVNAYATLANFGRMHSPSLIDYVQDRRGKVIWRSDKRECARCNMAEWDGTAMPRLGASGRQVMDPRTAYQVVHMLEGVVQRGTAVRVASLGLPLFGKTGTTTGPTNAWFIGGSPDIVAGAYIGFDKPRNLGGWVQGGNTGAPIFIDFVKATRDRWSDEPFVAPAGVRMVRIDRQSGRRVFDAWPTNEPKASVIWEAFKPSTEPPRATRQDEVAAKRNEILELIRRGRQVNAQAAAVTRKREVEAKADFVEEQGGIY